ncbi:hypothetical protein ACFWIB_43240, partial [Streptomyces sp. NPDC127051]
MCALDISNHLSHLSGFFAAPIWQASAESAELFQLIRWPVGVADPHGLSLNPPTRGRAEEVHTPKQGLEVHMTRHKRKPREHRRKPRRLITLTATMAAAAAIAGGITHLGLGDNAPAGAEFAETALPAAAPARDSEPAPIVGEPANETAKGMIFDGLKAAPKGDRCV